MATIRIVDVTDDQGRVVEPQWLARAEPVHLQLRPQLAGDYAGSLRRVFENGARMCVATDGDAVSGVAIHRTLVNTHQGLHVYVDDLVTDESRRSTGVGRALMEHLQRLARSQGCSALTLDSGTQRRQAHRFYFREGMVVTSFHFAKPLS